MVFRTLNSKEVEQAILDTRGEISNFDSVDWMKVESNVALTDGRNYALFHSPCEGVYVGHYFFRDRGKKARDLANEILKEIFTGPYGAKTIVGMTPIELKAALWMNRQIGFKEHGDIETSEGPCKLVILTKEQWERRT